MPHDVEYLIHKINLSKDKDLIKTLDTFNNSIVKTNFYNPKKSATAYRLDP